jgi:hypothetical protein
VVLYQLSYDPSLKVRQFTGSLPIKQGKTVQEIAMREIFGKWGRSLTADDMDGTDEKQDNADRCGP